MARCRVQPRRRVGLPNGRRRWLSYSAFPLSSSSSRVCPRYRYPYFGLPGWAAGFGRRGARCSDGGLSLIILLLRYRCLVLSYPRRYLIVAHDRLRSCSPLRSAPLHRDFLWAELRGAIGSVLGPALLRTIGCPVRSKNSRANPATIPGCGNRRVEGSGGHVGDGPRRTSPPT